MICLILTVTYLSPEKFYTSLNTVPQLDSVTVFLPVFLRGEWDWLRTVWLKTVPFVSHIQVEKVVRLRNYVTTALLTIDHFQTAGKASRPCFCTCNILSSNDMYLLCKFQELIKFERCKEETKTIDLWHLFKVSPVYVCCSETFLARECRFSLTLVPGDCVTFCDIYDLHRSFTKDVSTLL